MSSTNAISCPGQRRACYARRPQAVVIAFVDGNGAWLTEILDMDSIGLPGAPSRTRRDDRDRKGNRANGKRDVGRARRRHGCEKRREQGSDRGADILRDSHRRDAGAGLEEFGVKARESGIIALVDDAPHEQRHDDRQRYAMDADRVEVAEREQPRTERTDDDRRPAADLVRQVADIGNDEHRQDIDQNRHPKVNVFWEADAIRSLDRVGCTEYRGDHRDVIHQGHADDPQHVPPAKLESLDNWRLWNLAVHTLFGECRSLVDVAANDVARNDDDEAEQEGNSPAPGVERFLRHVMRERQENRRGKDLPGLHALEGEARVEAAPPKRSMLENHRTGAGYFAGDSEALYEPQYHEKHWSEHADLLICRQKPDGHR